MRIVFITDMHGVVDYVAPLAEAEASADLLLVGGDVTNFGGPDLAAASFAPLCDAFAEIRAVHGNVDRPEVAGWIADRGISLHGRGEVVGGVTLWGCGGSNITPLGTPTEYAEETIAGVLRSAAEAAGGGSPSIVVTHVPPYETSTDVMFLDKHVGSTAVREHLEQARPDLCLCGHIHEAVSEDTVGTTRVVNPGALSAGRYAAIEVDGDTVRVELKALSLEPLPRARATVRMVASKVSGFARHRLGRR